MDIIDDINKLLYEEEEITTLASNKLVASTKKHINNEIWKLLKPTFFSQIPLHDIVQILNKYGFVILQEDDTAWSGFLMGGVKKTEYVHFDLGFLNTLDQHKRYKKVTNSMLELSYYKMGNGKYEITARLT